MPHTPETPHGPNSSRESVAASPDAGESRAAGDPTSARTRRKQGAHSSGTRQRLQAAASLIGDDSREVRQALLQEFRRVGKSGQPLLRRAAHSDDARVRSHARSLQDSLQRDALMRRLTCLAARETIDLESVYWLLSRMERPDLDLRPYRLALDAMGKEVCKRTKHLRDDLQKGQVLVHYLGTELGYKGEIQASKQPDLVYLHRTIEQKHGLPLTLCALYSFVANRAGLRTGIVPLPGHVMLRLYGRYQNLIVDPFHGGEARTQDELLNYLRDHGLRFNPVWMHDASNRMLFARQLANLQNLLRAVDLPGRARSLDSMLMLLRR
jgi:regulator of sirC expression with transglutaminase-like and TPR domain